MFMEEISMSANKSKVSEWLAPLNYGYRWGCGPKVSEPSEKGHLYWNPPNFIPSIYKAKALGNTKTPGTNTLSRSTIDHCMKKYMYIWLNNGAEFWSVPIIVKNNYIHIWIWNKVKWTYYTIALDDVDCFICYWPTYNLLLCNIHVLIHFYKLQFYIFSLNELKYASDLQITP